MYSASICGHQMDTEFGYYLPHYDDESPEMQTMFVEIMGRDGDLNLSKQEGVVRYYSVDRDLRFEKVTDTSDEFDVNLEASTLRNALLGEDGRLIFDSDPQHYLSVTITSIDVSCEEGGRLVAVITAHADPYKYKLAKTIVSKMVDTSDSIVLSNAKKPAIPKVTCSAEMSLQYTILGVSYSVTLSSGVHYVDSLVLLQGNTTIGVTGSGTITFEYQEASF